REAHRFEDLAQLLYAERGLVHLLKRLPGKKILFTNAPQAYAKDVIKHLKLQGQFEQHISIESMRVHGKSQPKPSKSYLRKLLAKHGWQPRRCILVEDSAINLRAAKEVGIRTVLVTAHSAHYPQKRLTNSIDITVKSVFELARHYGLKK
ncbi:MAG: HAD-IA family hydrolase, partial [Undibacterium sp.]|nr:HAD-IA family hydrolase [Undibacterium sp.]